MNALLLAAGLGTRLRPLTDNKPKCLMNIGDRALLSIWLNSLNNLNIEKTVINTHYLAPQVNEFIEKNKNLYAGKLIISHEPKLLGTAGTLIANMHHYKDDDLMIIHADNYCLANLSEFIAIHEQRPKKCVMTMMTFESRDPTKCGIVKTKDGVVVDFFEKSSIPMVGMANAAIYLISKEMLHEVNNQFSHLVDISTELITHFIGRIYTYHTSSPNIDIGTIEAYNEASEIELKAMVKIS